MNTATNNHKKSQQNTFLLATEIDQYVEDKAEESNHPKASELRKLVHAGIKAVYGDQIRNNKVITA